MSLFSSVKNAVKKVASTVKSVVTAPAKAVSSVSNKIVDTVAPKPSIQVNNYSSGINGLGSAGGGGGGGTVAPAKTSTPSFTSNFVTSADSVFKPSTSSSSSSSKSSSKSSIPSPTTLTTPTKSFTLIGTPEVSSQLSPSGAGFSSFNSGTGTARQGGFGVTTSHGSFGMGENQISGTKLLQGDQKEEQGSILGNAFNNVWGAVKRPFVNAYNIYQNEGLYGDSLGKQTIPGLPNSPLARAATGIAQNNVGPALYDTLGAAGTGAAAFLGAGSKALYGVTGWDTANRASSFFTNMAASSQWNPLNAVPFDAGNPNQVMPAEDVRGAQKENTNVKPGSTVADLQGNLSSDTITTLDSLYKINNVGGEKYLDLSSMFDTQNQQTYTMTGPDGQTSTITQAQYDANPQYWEDLVAQGGFQVTPNQTMAVDIPPEIQDPVVRDSLQAQYNQLQKDAGITEAINQSKEIESQMAAIEAALIKQRDAVMEDPDFSLATKEGRINYIFKNSMEARTYEALTKRAEVLANFIDKQNEQIKTQLGFRQQDIQNQLAYQQANQPANRQTQVVTINGQQVLIDSQTGQPISQLGPQGDGQVDITKDQRYQNYQARETQWNNVVGTVSRFAPQGFNPSSTNAWNSVDWVAMANNKPAVDAIANAVVRMANPDITRAAMANDPYASESILNKAKQLYGELISDQNALPEKLKEAVGQAITYWNNSQQELSQAQSSGRTYATDSQDNTKFISAAKAAGYTDAQISQYLAQQSSAFNW